MNRNIAAQRLNRAIMQNDKHSGAGGNRGITCVLVMASLLFMFPLAVTWTNSLMSEAEIGLRYTTALSVFDILEGVKEKFVQMVLIPEHITGSQYSEVLFRQPTFLLLLFNSLKITVPVTLGSLIVSMMAAYAFTVWKFKYKEAIFFIYIVVMLMPLQAVLVPNYIVAAKLSIQESYLAIILPGIFSPFGTFLLRQSMKSIPQAYIEAAKIDGAGDWYTFTRIVIPQMKSGIAALCMLVFIEYWNLVEQAIIFIKDYYREPLSVFLSRIADGRMGLIFAASCVFMLLPFLILLLGQKDLEKGIELSGVK
jgi:multiple sugar transport system permease protein